MEQFAGETSTPIESEQHQQYVPSEHPNHEESYAEPMYIRDDQQDVLQYETLSAPPKKFLKTKRPPVAAKKRPSVQMVDLSSSIYRDTGAIPPAKFATMKEMTEDFWVERKRKMEAITEEEMSTKSKNMSVPMARVKKIMRIDEEVRNFNIASDAPIFMAQAAEFFIEEMTSMAWQHVSEARRRILLKTDVGTAVQKNDQFDFLIDFLPAKNAVPARPPPRKFPNTVHASPMPTQRQSFSGGSPQASSRMTEIEYQIPPSTSIAGPSTSNSFDEPCTSNSIAGPSTSAASAGPSTSTSSTSDHHFVSPIPYAHSRGNHGRPSN